MHFGAGKLWYACGANQYEKMVTAFRSLYPEEYAHCENAHMHKEFYVHPDILRRHHGLKMVKTVQRAGELIVTKPFAFHAVSLCVRTMQSCAMKSFLGHDRKKSMLTQFVMLLQGFSLGLNGAEASNWGNDPLWFKTAGMLQVFIPFRMKSLAQVVREKKLYCNCVRMKPVILNHHCIDNPQVRKLRKRVGELERVVELLTHKIDLLAESKPSQPEPKGQHC